MLTDIQIHKLQEFQQKLNQEPPQEWLDKTPDGKALTLPISFVEMKLDEIYMGRYSMSEMKWEQIINEVVGSLTLEVIHPITGDKITRQGAAAITIMVDKNTNPLDLMNNKKGNALDLAFPKLKAECVKNAAQSLGKIFGRDLNRKKKRGEYKPQYSATTILRRIKKVYDAKKTELSEELQMALERIIENKEVSSYSKAMDALGIKDED